MTETSSVDSQTLPVVCLTQIRKSFDGKAIINDLDLTINHGEFLTILGPSGCGKTTVLRLIAGLEEVDSGQVVLDGEEITHLPAEQRHVNTVFQSYALFPHMTVFENVAFGLRMQKTPRDEITPRVMDALRMVQLDEMAQRRPHQLSGGQQQRVAIARAVVNKPRVLLLDESLSALDYKLRKQMQNELKALQRKLGITFIFVTHDQEEALTMSDRIVVMRDGRIEQDGTPREIYEEPKICLSPALSVKSTSLMPAYCIVSTSSASAPTSKGASATSMSIPRCMSSRGSPEGAAAPGRSARRGDQRQRAGRWHRRLRART